MSYKINVAPSKVVSLSKNQQESVIDNANAVNQNKKMNKDLDERRKDGTIPALKDVDGKDINPHTPLYIMQVPWYYDKLNPTLKHQEATKGKKEYASISSWYKRGTTGECANKFMKGACENCGALTHKRKECFERPRSIGAKFTNEDIAENDFIQPNIETDYDGKRDRWNNYDIQNHTTIAEEFQKVDNERKKIKFNEIDESLNITDNNEAQELNDEDKGEIPSVDQKVDSKQRITVRNLRLREDTAKYLYNLDENSAFYDPKSRSMRENPFSGKEIEFEQQQFRGDNEFYKSKEMNEFLRKQVFAWDANKSTSSSNINLQTNPTETEKLFKDKLSDTQSRDSEFKQKIHERYGGEEHLNSIQEGIEEKSQYVEYTQRGAVKDAKQHEKVLSKYIEDVYTNNHTQIFGSYWADGQWGYKCCHSLIKNSYCGGLKAIAAFKASKEISNERNK